MEWNVIVGMVCTVLGAVFGYIAFARNNQHDNQEEGRKDGTILTELGYIKANTDEIKAEQKEQRKLNTEFATRLTKVEASAERAHFRIDHIEKLEDQNR